MVYLLRHITDVIVSVMEHHLSLGGTSVHCLHSLLECLTDTYEENKKAVYEIISALSTAQPFLLVFAMTVYDNCFMFYLSMYVF